MPRAGLLLSLATLAAIVATTHACATRTSAPPRTLGEIVRAYDREAAPYFPFTASERGNHAYDRVLANDISEDYRHGLAELCTRYREDVERIDPSRLFDSERLTRELFAYRLRSCVEDLQYPWHLLPISQIGGWPLGFPVLGAGRGLHPFRTVLNYDDFLGRVDGFTVWVDTAIDNMRAGIALGITQPRVVMLKVPPQLEAQIVDDPTASMFYEPIRKIPDGFDAETRERLDAVYRDAITRKIVPAYRKLLAFVRDEYIPACRTSHGFGDLHGGAAWYRYQVRRSTTTARTPDEIYELGLSEVKRLNGEIAALQRGVAGTEPLRTYTSVDELVHGYEEFRDAVESALPKLFGHLPRAGFEIRAIEAFRDASAATSYEAASLDGTRPGVFYLNAADVRRGGTATVARSLFLHEAVPGHHLQIAIQRENAALPSFRQFAWYTAYGEGWALYAETLGDELGVYANPRDRLTALSWELFRAQRLVVDVGLHAKGWSRERVIEYLGSDANAERETERYMVWPAQALGYKIGQLEIRALRRKAEAALGPAFDVRAFHDALLIDGPMPLDILAAKMDRWIAARRRAP